MRICGRMEGRSVRRGSAFPGACARPPSAHGQLRSDNILILKQRTERASSYTNTSISPRIRAVNMRAVSEEYERKYARRLRFGSRNLTQSVRLHSRSPVPGLRLLITPAMSMGGFSFPAYDLDDEAAAAAAEAADVAEAAG